MKFIRNILFVGLAGLALASCKTAPDFYGDGPINISANMQSYFEKYKSGGGPSYFAISEDGRMASWSYCPSGPDGCSVGEPPYMMAINGCNRRGKKCKIFARGKNVVWKGPVTYGGSPVASGASPSAKSDEVVCAFAVDYAVEPFTWSTHTEVTKYVAEAKRRGLSLEDCDKLN